MPENGCGMEHKNSPVALIELKRSLLPPEWEETPRVIDISECRVAGQSLAQSFATDTLSTYLLDGDDMSHIGPEEKWKIHVDHMTYNTAAHIINGTVTAIGPDYECVALWMPPGANNDGWRVLFRSGLWRLYFQLSSEGWKRYYDELLPLVRHTKREVMGNRDGDCYHLVFIGTKPTGRGRGYASKLIVDMIKKADVENRPMYLESTTLANNAYYAKFGFELKKEVSLNRGHSPILLYVMVREPLPLVN